MRRKTFTALCFFVFMIYFNSTTLVTHAAPVLTKKIPPLVEDTKSEQYSYVQSATIAISPSSTKVSYLVNISGSLSVTSITGTMTIYKGTIPIYNLPLTSGRLMYETGDINSFGSGSYRITFSGTVTSTHGSETLEIESTNSY